MKNFFILSAVLFIIGLSIIKGREVEKGNVSNMDLKPQNSIPYIGRIQVLNGCGGPGSARIVADFLRRKHFDVKNIGNADNWNFPETLIISRTRSTTIAEQVAEALDTKNIVLIRTAENLYDVTVIVGPDYREIVN